MKKRYRVNVFFTKYFQRIMNVYVIIMLVYVLSKIFNDEKIYFTCWVLVYLSFFGIYLLLMLSDMVYILFCPISYLTKTKNGVTLRPISLFSHWKGTLEGTDFEIGLNSWLPKGRPMFYKSIIVSFGKRISDKQQQQILNLTEDLNGEVQFYNKRISIEYEFYFPYLTKKIIFYDIEKVAQLLLKK